MPHAHSVPCMYDMSQLGGSSVLRRPAVARRGVSGPKRARSWSAAKLDQHRGPHVTGRPSDSVSPTMEGLNTRFRGRSQVGTWVGGIVPETTSLSLGGGADGERAKAVPDEVEAADWGVATPAPMERYGAGDRGSLRRSVRACFIPRGPTGFGAAVSQCGEFIDCLGRGTRGGGGGGTARARRRAVRQISGRAARPGAGGRPALMDAYRYFVAGAAWAG